MKSVKTIKINSARLGGDREKHQWKDHKEISRPETREVQSELMVKDKSLVVNLACWRMIVFKLKKRMQSIGDSCLGKTRTINLKVLKTSHTSQIIYNCSIWQVMKTINYSFSAQWWTTWWVRNRLKNREHWQLELIAVRPSLHRLVKRTSSFLNCFKNQKSSLSWMEKRFDIVALERNSQPVKTNYT